MFEETLTFQVHPQPLFQFRLFWVQSKMEPLEVRAYFDTQEPAQWTQPWCGPCTPKAEESQEVWEEAWHSQQTASLPRQPEIVGRKATALLSGPGPGPCPPSPAHSARPQGREKGLGRRKQPLPDLRRDSHLNGEKFSHLKGKERLCENRINLNTPGGSDGKALFLCLLKELNWSSHLKHVRSYSPTRRKPLHATWNIQRSSGPVASVEAWAWDWRLVSRAC